ncbi:MAG TPA: hypothetical protein VNA29_07190 [Sphingomicrobium sp.]|nr:hypothetical protein [Sphingomicrobium sp.]
MDDDRRKPQDDDKRFPPAKDLPSTTEPAEDDDFGAGEEFGEPPSIEFDRPPPGGAEGG